MHSIEIFVYATHHNEKIHVYNVTIFGEVPVLNLKAMISKQSLIQGSQLREYYITLSSCISDNIWGARI